MCENNKKRVVIIGAGLVGSLCACFMAKRGYDVEIYEQREDMRTAKNNRGKSINLAISHRGRQALRSLGLEGEILKNAIPMKGRLLHSTAGELKSVLYDPSLKQCIYSVGRNYLNKKLVEATAKFPNIKIHFNHVLTESNFRDGIITLKNLLTNEEFQENADLIIGADGAHSKLRLAMQQTPQFQYSQQYIEHGYLELSILPSMGHNMVPDHLHIWPRGEFMMIALPNQDSSWTLTLFMPFKIFEQLTSEEKVLKFFQDTFPDSVKSIGKDKIVETFLTTRPSQLVSIKCSPYNVGSKFLIIGDAAHAMVPFYGQGMNAGFQDCFLLDKILEKNKDNIEKTLLEYSDARVKNAHAICDLAMYNYIEMRELVNTAGFKMRKIVDNILFKFLQNKWIPLYNSVSFSTMDYQECVDNRKWQDGVIYKIITTAGLLTVTSAAICIKNSFFP